MIKKFKEWLKTDSGKVFGVVVLIVSTWRIGLEVVNQFLAPIIKPATDFLAQPDGIRFGLYRWLQWDGRWYLSVIQDGYIHVPSAEVVQENIAFFPGFPIITRVASELTLIPYVYAGLFINFLLSIGIGVLVYQLYTLLTRKDKNKKGRGLGAWLAIAVVFAFPSALFFAAYYVEALLVFSMLGSIFFGLKRHYWIAAIFAGVATLTKITGAVCAPTLLVIFIEQEKVLSGSLVAAAKQYGLKIVGLMAVSLSGILALMAYMWARFGDPLLFYRSHVAWGRKEGGFFIADVWTNYYSHIFNTGYFGGRGGYAMGLFLMAVPVFTLVGIILAIRWRIWWLATYLAFVLILPLSTGTLLSINRVALVLAPVAVFFIGCMQPKHYKYMWCLVCLMAIFEIIFVAGFLQGTYFAG